MFGLLKSKRIIIENEFNSNVTHCCFISQRRVLVIFANRTFLMINTESEGNKIVYQDRLDVADRITDCQRIKDNVCAILSNNLYILTFLKYVSDEEVLMGNIDIKEMHFFESLQLSSKLLPFKSTLFAIQSDYFRQDISYFTIFRQTASKQFSYDISIINYEYDPMRSSEEILKPLESTGEIAFFRQNESDGVEWKIKIIELENQIKRKEVDLTELLNERNWILDLMAKGNEEYCLFVSGEEEDNNELLVYSIRLYETNGSYTHQISLLYKLSIENGQFMQILDTNLKEGYCLIKLLAHTTKNHEILDNALQLRNLQTGQLIDRMGCNLKYLSFNPKRTQMADYSQNVTTHQHIIIHIRAIFSKKSIYQYFLRHNRLSEQKTLERYMQEILQLL